MTTSKKRRMVSLSDKLEKVVVYLSKRDEVPPSTKLADLIQKAVELDEDEVWNRLAGERDIKGATFVSHKDAWS